MRRIRTRGVFFVLVAGAAGSLNLFAGGWEDLLHDTGYNTGIVPTESSSRLPLVGSYTLEEVGGRSRFTKPGHEKMLIPAVDAVPDTLDEACESGEKDNGLLGEAALTPSQITAVALNRFLLLGAAAEADSRAVRTPSPVKKRRLQSLLEDLAAEAKSDPEQVKRVLESADMSVLRALLSGRPREGGESPSKKRGVQEDDRSDQNTLLRRSQSLHGKKQTQE